MYVLTLTKGTAKDGDVKANVEVTGLPSRVRLYSRRRFINKYNNNNSIKNSKPSSTN
ncbi:hypothetical protein I5860_016990 [Clostridioides difficile]